MPGSFSKVLYPLLMFVTVFRTIVVRVHPDLLLVFKPCEDDSSAPSGRGRQVCKFRPVTEAARGQRPAQQPGQTAECLDGFPRLCFARKLAQVHSVPPRLSSGLVVLIVEPFCPRWAPVPAEERLGGGPQPVLLGG